MSGCVAKSAYAWLYVSMSVCVYEALTRLHLPKRPCFCYTSAFQRECVCLVIHISVRHVFVSEWRSERLTVCPSTQFQLVSPAVSQSVATSTRRLPINLFMDAYLLQAACIDVAFILLLLLLSTAYEIMRKTAHERVGTLTFGSIG